MVGLPVNSAQLLTVQVGYSSSVCAAVLRQPQPKNKPYVFKVILKSGKISNPFCSIVDKKAQKIQKKSKTDHVNHFNNVATLLLVLLPAGCCFRRKTFELGEF